MIAVSPLAAVLAAAIAAAPDSGTVRLTGTVLTEKKVETVSVRVFALGDAVVQRPELVRTPLQELTQAPGPLSLALEPGQFPLRIEVKAAGHLAAAVELFEPGARALPPLWLPAGKAVKVRVLASGQPAVGALVRGDLEQGGLPGDGVWRAVAPTLVTDAAGTAEVVVPATGELQLTALASDGRWGEASATLPSPGGARCEIGSRPLVVAVRNAKGEPIAAARVAVVGSPAGSVAFTDAAGRARVQVRDRGSSVVVALADGCGARVVAYPAARAELAMTCTSVPTLALSWSGGGETARVRLDWLPAALLGGGALQLAGGRGGVPYFGHGGAVTAWSPGAAGQRLDVEEGATGATIRFAAPAAVDGTVVDAADRPVPGIPVWRWTLPEFALSGRFRGQRSADMLERSVLPGGVSDTDGRFTIAPLLPALTRLVATQAGNPPADSGPLELVAGKRELLTLKLDAGTWLALTVTDPEGRPLAGAVASLAPNPDAHSGRMVIRLGGADRNVTERIAEATSDRDGKVLLRGVRPGAMKLRLALPGYVERSVDVEVPPQGVDAGQQVLEPGTTVLGRVVDERGAGIPDAEIRAGSMIGAFGPAITTSDATGAFAVADRPREGETYLVAQRGENERSESVRVALPPQGVVELVIKGRRTLTGRVVDEATAAPVVGALVSASRTMKMQSGGGGMAFAFMVRDSTDEVETDGEGRFRIEGVAAGGEYTLNAAARSYRSLEQQVKVPEVEAPRPLTVLLKPGLAVHGIVLEPADGPAPGVVVESSPAARQGGMALREQTQTARSAADGSFTIVGLEPGQFELRATADDGATAREVVEAGRDEPVELRLEGAGAIEGRVVTDDGPVREATVSGFSGDFNQIDPVKVDSAGAFRMPRVPPGQYQVWAEAEGWAQAGSQATVEPGRTATVTLTLKRGGTVNGRVLGLGAKELERCEVFSRGARAKPSPDGSFTLTGVPLGPGEVGAFVLPDAKRRSAPIDLKSLDQPVSVELDFAQGVHLSGSVRRRGAPVPGVIVEVVGNGGAASGANTTSDAQGQWELAGVEPGQVEVRALDRQSNVLAARQLQVRDDARVDLEVPGGTIVGKVVALPDRTSIIGARVHAAGAGTAPVSREARTDQAGTFALEELPDGDLLLRGEAEGYAPAEARVTVSMGAAREVSLVLEEEKRLRLLIREEDGSVPDQVQLLPVRGGRIDDPVWVTCDRAGRASVGSLPAGGYTFLVSSGGGEALVNLAVPSEETAVVLRATGSVRAVVPVGQAWRLRVVSAESGLTVPVGPWQNPARGEWVEVRGGVLAIRVPAGTYVVQGLAPDGTTHEQRVAVPPEGDVIAAL